MPPINRSEMDDVLSQVEARLGKDKAKALSAILADPELRDQIVIMGPAEREGGVRSAQDVRDFIAGKLERKRLVSAFRGMIFGVHEALPLRSIAQDEAPQRPREAGLPESLRSFCEAKRTLPGKMQNAAFDPMALESEADEIDLLRGLLGVSVRFTGTLLRNLAQREDGACRVMKSAYANVRQAGKSDDPLGVFLGAVEDYLYGAAQQGADNRARMDEVRKTSFAAGEQQALRSAERNVRKSLADEILGLSEDLRRAAAPDDRGAPR